jgi:putative transposase
MTCQHTYRTVDLNGTRYLADGRAFRVLSLVENVSRVSPALEADFKMTGERVCELLIRAIVADRMRKTIRLDYGPEFAGKALDAWAYQRGVKLSFSRPGKPTDNAFCESFNGKLRDEFLTTHWFENMADVRVHFKKWREE